MRYPCSGTAVSCRRIGGIRSSGTAVLPHKNIQPGLAFFYGGLVRRKNVVNTMMACVAIMGLSVFMWVLFGYSLAFGSDHGGVIGDFGCAW